MSFKVSDRNGRKAPEGTSFTSKDLGERAQAAFDAMSDGVIVLSQAHAVVFTNRAALRMNELDKDDVLDAPLAKFMEKSAIDWADLSDALEAGRKAEIVSQNHQGKPFLTSIRTIRLSSSSDGFAMLVQRDLEVFDHDRRRASSGSADNTFRFLNERALRPDFARQRALSEALDAILDHGEKAMMQGARVLLLGESGAGKTEIARYLNDFLNASAAPFVHVNCGAIPDTLFESEMFGYERGAFTGALQSGKKGLIETADGGTLFLDEVAEIPLTVQAKLLKFLEDGTVQRVGAGKSRNVRVRVISATNRTLDDMVEAGFFRRDLYYRLAVMSLEVKPLRQTPELIDHLISRFLQLTNQRRATRLRLTEDCRRWLQRYSFPGNIRELHNLVQHLSVVAETLADVRHLPEKVLLEQAMPQLPEATAQRQWHDPGLKEQVKAYERQLIEDAIARHGSKRKAAEALGVDIGTVVRKTQAKH